MKKIRLGNPEKITPSKFCKGFNYIESYIKYPINVIEYKQTKRGFLVSLPKYGDEQIFGLGLQLKKVNLTSKKFTLRVNADPVAATGDSHAPVPFFVSTHGYGIYLDTTRNAEFYFGSSELSSTESTIEKNKIKTSTDDLYGDNVLKESKIEILIPNCEGVDLYIMEWKTITEVVAKYNMLAGGGCDVAEWTLYPIYRCYTKYNQSKIIKTAESFLTDKLPIKTIGLEPGWQTHSYSCSYIWNKELYPNAQEMVDKLKNMGMHVNLWEHAFVHPTSPIYNLIKNYSGSHKVWHGYVPDFATEEARKIFSDYHKTIVSMGIDGFKLDECDGSDITGSWSFPLHSEFHSGMDGEQYHSMFGVLYMQTIMDALEHKPILSEVRNAGALSASYPFVLYSDLYDHKDFIRGCLTSGFSGILWTPELRDAKTKEEFLKRLQTTVFSPQCLINAWYCEKKPWSDFDCLDEVKYWLDERVKLIPMLKKAFVNYKENGVPPMRAVVSDYTSDPETYYIEDEYLLCEKLLIAPIFTGESERKVYLPKSSKWRNYFTKENVENGHLTVKSDSILVYEKI